MSLQHGGRGGGGLMSNGGRAIVGKRKTSQNNNFYEVALSNEVKCHCNDFLYMNRQVSLLAIFSRLSEP